MTSALFSPISIGPLTLTNRIIVSPMCQYSSENGNADEWHRVHLGGLSLSGAGLLMVEATGTEARGRITHHCLGLYSDDNEEALRSVVKTVRSLSKIKLGIQIGHAGRKASTQRPWEGRGPLQPDEEPWETLSPSGIPFTEKGPATRQMTEADMADIVAAHVRTAQRALGLGFDLIELHSAHGYLLSSFLSPLSNQRTDHYGGSLENRMRFPLEVVKAVRAVWPSDRAMSIKFNGTDWAAGGFSPDDAVIYARALADAGLDLVILSGGGVVLGGEIPSTPGYQLEAAEKIKAAGLGVVVGTVGLIYEPRFAEEIIAGGRVDVVALARAFLYDPRWAYHAAVALGADLPYARQYERASPKAWSPALLL